MKYKYDSCREEVDVGCKYADNCFKCPFDDCIVTMHEVDDEEPEYMAQRQIILGRVAYVKKLKEEDKMSVRSIARLLKCSEKSVRNDLIIAKTLLEGKNVEQD